ncbi:alpha/beta fold hydrolase [Virgibacillus litoralis]|uniref:Pimeloyl-ACP methyl ester carboxylesterase n=1 Tax=Virgibacillus litoralis TaxID=578221 RepID=A0ABS4HJT4_9BACI|nr:alpha/beta hydrolase [Virgibacillus litoralis]MBP1950879.1 pimeloyl-ACP methyl ester carboxylesterase [Virgibacillus litoralis]
MESKIITLDNGLDVNVNIWGTKNNTSVILLHGLGSTGSSFDELATILSQNYNVYAFDLPGHGGSTYFNNEHCFSMDSLADWVKEVISYFNLEDFHIVGHSVGGYIGLVFAKKFSLKSLILLDGGYIRAKSIPENRLEEELRMTEQHMENFTFSSWEDYEKGLSIDGLSQRQIELSKDSMKSENGIIKLIVTSHVAKYIVKQKYNEPTRETLSDVNSPVLILRSTIPKDFNVIRNSEANRLKQCVNVSIIDVMDATHDIYWDQPMFLSEQISNWLINH